MYSEQQQQRVLSAARGLRDTFERHMFGCWCLFAFGRMVAVVMNDNIVIRLDPDARRRALELPGAAPFTPRPGMTARELVRLPPSEVRSRARLASWLNAAYEYAATTAKPSSPQPASRRRGRRTR
jgi:TfoX/Sxy family transcriptional regulator of competence genes